jgi:GDPmannose 4,6-dehydratase
VFAVVGILFNHKAKRRGYWFVTRKVSGPVAKIKHGLATELVLGILDARRGWGYAPEYVRVIWAMLQRDAPDDCVVATGVSHTVREFGEIAFNLADLPWDRFVRIDEILNRPAETRELRGDAGKAQAQLGWSPRLRFEQIVERMVSADIQRLSQVLPPN